MDGLADRLADTPEPIDAASPRGGDPPAPSEALADHADDPADFAETPSTNETVASTTGNGEPVESIAEPRPADRPTEILPHRVVEAILFAADAPLPAAKIAQVLGIGTARDVRKHIATLNDQYREWGLSFRVEEIAGGFQMLTLPAYNTWLTKLLRTRQETKLSQAAMETLAIVAYKQPCTRADVEAVRGVAAGDLLNRLREMNLVKIVGRAEDLGRPLLYGTTRRFLEAFGLPSLEDLPKVEALSSGGGASRAAAQLAETLPPEGEVQAAPAEEGSNPAAAAARSTPTTEPEQLPPAPSGSTKGATAVVETGEDSAGADPDAVTDERDRAEDEQIAELPPPPPLRLAVADDNGTP